MTAKDGFEGNDLDEDSDGDDWDGGDGGHLAKVPVVVVINTT